MAGKKSMADKLAQITKSKVPKGAPRSKRPGANNKPSRVKYWQSGRLEERKIKRLMKHQGLTRAEAFNLWRSTRKGRVKGWITG